MIDASIGRYGRPIVAALIVLQILLLWLSFGPLYRASVFCTGPTSSVLAWVFGGLHFGLLGIAVLGVSSLRFAQLRLLYLALVLLSFAALPIQSELVSQGKLSCDAP